MYWATVLQYATAQNCPKLIIKRGIYLMWNKNVFYWTEISFLNIPTLSDSLLKLKGYSNKEKYKSALEIRNKYWAFLFPIFSYLEFKRTKFLKQTRSHFLKVCFNKFYLVHFRISYLMCSLSHWKNKVVTLHKKLSFPWSISSINISRSVVSSFIWSHVMRKYFMENLDFCAV